MKFDIKVLNKLVDKYENSSEFWNCNAKARTIRLIAEKDLLFKNYFGTESFRYRADMEDDITEIEKKNFIVIQRDLDTHLIQYISLNKCVLVDIYKYLKREPKNISEQSILQKINRLRIENTPSNISNNYLLKLVDLINEHKSILSYAKNIEDIELQIKFIRKIEENTAEILIRNFSKRHFGDSKLIERNASKILKLFNEFGEDKFEKIDLLLANYSIVTNTKYSYMRGGIVFEINNHIINLDKINIDFSLTSDAIAKMRICNITKPKVITIENLTTYNYYNNDNALIIYLGGFHNSDKTLLLTKINNANPNLEFFHMGDIDCGGFRILENLKNKTGIPFKPLMMDVEVLKKYKNECQPLTINDRKNIESLLLNKKYAEYEKVLKFMLDNNYKLEQESILFE